MRRDPIACRSTVRVHFPEPVIYLHSIRRYLCEKTNPPTINVPKGVATSRSLSKIISLVVIMQYVSCIMLLMWIIIVCNRRRDSVAIADGLVPIWHQGMCNHLDGVAQEDIKGAVTRKRKPETSFQLNQYLSYRPHSSFKSTSIFCIVIKHIRLGVYHTGGFNAMLWRHVFKLTSAKVMDCCHQRCSMALT